MIKLLTSVYFHFSISELNFILTVIKNLLVEISLICSSFFFFFKYCNEVSAGRRVNISPRGNYLLQNCVFYFTFNRICASKFLQFTPVFPVFSFKVFPYHFSRGYKNRSILHVLLSCSMTQYSCCGSRDEFNNLEIWGETTTAN